MNMSHPDFLPLGNQPLPGAWARRARCIGMDVAFFFPERGRVTQVQAAKNICNRCPVRDECLEYALRWNIKGGVWGETSEHERRKLRRNLRNELVEVA